MSVKIALIAGGTLSAAPSPVEDLGHIIVVALNPGAMLGQLLLEALHDVARRRAQTWNAAQRLDGQVIPAHAIDHGHVEGSRGRALLHVSPNVETSRIRPVV